MKLIKEELKEPKITLSEFPFAEMDDKDYGAANPVYSDAIRQMKKVDKIRKETTKMEKAEEHKEEGKLPKMADGAKKLKLKENLSERYIKEDGSSEYLLLMTNSYKDVSEEEYYNNHELASAFEEIAQMSEDELNEVDITAAARVEKDDDGVYQIVDETYIDESSLDIIKEYVANHLNVNLTESCDDVTGEQHDIYMSDYEANHDFKGMYDEIKDVLSKGDSIRLIYDGPGFTDTTFLSVDDDGIINYYNDSTDEEYTFSAIDELIDFFKDSLGESVEGDKIAQDYIDDKNKNFEKDKEAERQYKVELAKNGVPLNEEDDVSWNELEAERVRKVEDLTDLVKEYKKISSVINDALLNPLNINTEEIEKDIVTLTELAKEIGKRDADTLAKLANGQIDVVDEDWQSDVIVDVPVVGEEPAVAEPIAVSVEEPVADSLQDMAEDNAMATLINGAVTSKLNSISELNDLIVSAEAYGQSDIANIVRDIVVSENETLGKLQAALENVSIVKSEPAVSDGKAEAESQLN